MMKWLPIIMLLMSNIFMTFAWYGHLKFNQSALWKVILISWLIAFFEYCLQVPANRIGFQFFSAPQLKIIQEALTFVVFSVFSILYLKQHPSLNDYAAMALIFLAVSISLFKPL